MEVMEKVIEKSRVLDMLKSRQTITWPLDIKSAVNSEQFDEKEIKGQPSTERTKRMFKNFLESKCRFDAQMPIFYTEGWKKFDGDPLYIRRGKAYRYMLEHMTPVIKDDEVIVMSKTRYSRGATMYPQFSTEFMINFLNKAEDEEAKLFSVEAKDDAHNVKEEGWIKLGQLFSIHTDEVGPMKECLDYWKTRSIEDVSNKIMKDVFPLYDDLVKAWKVGLFPGSGLASGCDGRWTPAYDIIVERGLEDVIAECKQHLKDEQPIKKEGSEKIFFWQACIEVCQGAINWAKNYADEARRLADTCDDPARKEELLSMAETLEWVPARPARTFREGMQAAWAGHMMVWNDSISLGLSPAHWGQLLYPLYKGDLEAGRITPDEAQELWEIMRIKFSSEEYITPSAWAAMASSNSFQHMIVGGVNPKTGECWDNELEEMILQAGINVPTPQPTLGILVSSKTSERLLLKAAECTKAGNGYPAWFNYDMMVKHLLWCHAEEGITLEDAQDVAISGCVEIGISGKTHGINHPAFYNEGKTLELALNNGVDPRTGIVAYEGLKPINSYEDVWNNFVTIREHFMKVYMRYWNQVIAVQRQVHPKIAGSVLMHDCVKVGRPQDDNGCRYNKSITLLDSGTVNVCNGLAAMKKLIWDDKKYTYDEFKESMDSNFGFIEGALNGNFSMLNQEMDSEKYLKYAQIHKDVLEAPKFGNDDDYVDDIFVDLWHDYDRVCASETTYLGHRWLTAALSISAHGPHGRVTGATPDGRLSGVTLCDGILSASPGTDTNGPIALIKSGVKLDPTQYRSVQLNMKLHPNAIRGVEGSKNFTDFIKSYFNMGGYHVQFNIVDSNMLRDAQNHPENYRDLMVRVAGFSAYWVELGKPIQDEVIARTEYNAV
jgi:formate C-acetyltransferase/4-hydroxyphenylacetate decarboxylase large subunit